MKEYGIQESWTKLFTVSNMPIPSKSYRLTKAIHAFEDDQVLLAGVCRNSKILCLFTIQIMVFLSLLCFKAP